MQMKGHHIALVKMYSQSTQKDVYHAASLGTVAIADSKGSYILTENSFSGISKQLGNLNGLTANYCPSLELTSLMMLILINPVTLFWLGHISAWTGTDQPEASTTPFLPKS